jgi:hypothetical protein
VSRKRSKIKDGRGEEVDGTPFPPHTPKSIMLPGSAVDQLAAW